MNRSFSCTLSCTLSCTGPFLLLVLSAASNSYGSEWSAPSGLKPDKVHVADHRKTDTWIREGLVTGGDGSIHDISVRTLRHGLLGGAKGKGVERVVVELSGPRKGILERAPYFHVAVTPELQQLSFTLWGSPKLQLDNPRILTSGFVSKSKIMQNGFKVSAPIEKDRWTLAMPLQKSAPVAVEVFELSNPLRIVIDIKK